LTSCEGPLFLEGRPSQRLPPDSSLRRRLSQDRVSYSLRELGIRCHAVRINECPLDVPADDERGIPDLLDKCVIIYLDDIMIYSTTQEQHLKDLEAVFQCLQQNRLITKGSKCEFLKPELEFLGHVISTKGVKIDPREIRNSGMEAVDQPPGGAIVFGVRQLCAPVYPQLLQIADPERPFEVVTDASDIAIEAVLLQDFGDGLQPIAYESRKLQSAERNYPVHDKEMLAIVHAFKIWRCYLTGADVTVRTYHKSLQYLRTQPNLNPWQIRWLDYVESNFTYRITYKKGANNIADALSRPSAQTDAVPITQTDPLLSGLFTHGYSTDPLI
ncbi:hypothetical protein CLOM_g2318, partial [Closterium sp. NIES-68]